MWKLLLLACMACPFSVVTCDDRPVKCGKNQVYSNCTDGGCQPRLCSEIGFPQCDKKCKPGCVCKDGYVLNDDGICILIAQCPSCGGDKNAQQGCSNYCGNSCGERLRPRPCPLFCIVNGCQCRPGFVYDPNVKACVKPRECTPACKFNEVYNSCTNSGCTAKNCSQIGKPVPCIRIDPRHCIKGCVCIPGYLRDKNGTCVPKNQCPRTKTSPTQAICIGKNEYFEPCIRGCTNQSCSDLGKRFNCPNESADRCKSGCRCKTGFYRDVRRHNECVPQDQCPTPKCTDGEVWEWCPTVKCDGDHCPKTRTSPQTCPVGIVCDPPRCICSYNSKKDWKTHKCILITDCPPFKCDRNEEYQACPVDCPGEKCSDYTNPKKCPPFRIGITVPCRPACKCIKGYYRDKKGNCIPARQCPTISSSS